MNTCERMTKEDIEAITVRILESTQGSKIPIPVYEIAEQNNIEVFLTAFNEANMPNISGAIRKEGNKVSIFLNKDHPQTRKNFTLAHELGHYFLNHLDKDLVNGELTPDSNIRYRFDDNGCFDPLENDANHFAACLLMPEHLIRVATKSVGPYVKKLADLFYVSEIAMSIRLEYLGYL